MTFHRRSRSEQRARYFFTIGILVFVALAFFRGPIGGAVSYAAAPVHALQKWFEGSSATIPLYFKTKFSLLRERDALRAELDARAHDATRLTQLSRENEMLRGIADAAGQNRIISSVVLRPNDTPYDTLLVDRGSVHGITSGALVYAEGNIAIGRVATAFPLSSLVMLFSTPGIETPVYIFGPDTFARAEGIGGGVLRVGVPQGVPLSGGNVVILPTLSSGIIGTIEYIESEDSNPEQYGFVTVGVSLSALRFVAIDPTPMPDITVDEAVSAVSAARELFGTTTLLAIVNALSATGTDEGTATTPD